MQNPFKNQDDKLQFAKVLDRYTQAGRDFVQTHTEFLNPLRCAAFLQALPNSSDVSATPYGGYDSAERRIIIFNLGEGEGAPAIVPIAVTYHKQFAKPPSHRDYLGAVLGLGLDRGTIGDIVLVDDGAVLYVLEGIADFIAENLTLVGRASVKAKARQQLHGAISTATTRRINVPSMRLDAVVGAALNLSRGKAATLIDGERVYVNWKPAKKTHTVATGDAIAVRGVGRVKIEAVEGTTKKDRIVLMVSCQK